MDILTAENEKARLLVVDEFLAWAMLQSVRLCRYERDGDSLLGQYKPLNARETQQLGERYFFTRTAPARPSAEKGEG